MHYYNIHVFSFAKAKFPQKNIKKYCCYFSVYNLIKLNSEIPVRMSTVFASIISYQRLRYNLDRQMGEKYIN